ncbi:uncharacterized protein Z519_10491 [Cladophialophora bantiana CBS 173.52]|uniref:Uncharacterized protein n=1 Tax=Cladophialophora bantiana (strain ATCC 10958 / CBS 173.52 / CDC B-1940 / NIH 8579) TaxID=1442370 RepID=A0A0D2EG64_CLAB1|nr:uncharacterized protein Z519_10491 [Cladophialophora bantiana CBS 173.52]KIW89006.1 hypothetical protein Z519_10491 [Cladophialophora bantiana CBS 173.52]
MAAMYGVRELYGGALTVELPVELIDSSDIRQIPDHQEVFLSPTTLTSIIFEINNYVGPSITDPRASSAPTTTTSTTTLPDGTITTTTTTAVSQTINGTVQPPMAELDAEAAKYHFTDVISPPDTLASPLPNPQPVRMVDASLASYPAYMLAGNINSFETSRTAQQSPNGGRQISPSAIASQQQPQLSSLVHQLALLIRLQPYSTDLCVRINVPVKEFIEAGQRTGSTDSGATEAMIAQEVGYARDILTRIVETLAVRDWRLFNA